MVQLRQVAQMQVWFSRPVICDILQTNLKHPIPLLVYPAPFQRRVTIETGGFRAIEIKIGEGDLENDVATVSAVRAMIGPTVKLRVDCNQSLDPIEACRRITRLADFDVYWVEEPVKAEDLAGHAQVRAATSAPIQTGENWWFPRDMAKAIAAGASDYAMLDVMKIGGVTGWLSALGQAEGASLPISSHIFVEASAHLLAITPTVHWLEHLDIAGAILAEPNIAVNGTVRARGPGFGLDWDEHAIARLAIGRY
jgi:mandelate racemase